MRSASQSFRQKISLARNLLYRRRYERLAQYRRRSFMVFLAPLVPLAGLPRRRSFRPAPPA
jgi:hypothetical protein